MLKKSLLWLMIFILPLILAACGDSVGEKGPSLEGEWPVEDCVKDVTEPDSPAPGDTASGAETDEGGEQEDMRQYLRQVTVQIRGPEYWGSGVIWAEEEDTLVIATAAHVAEDNGPLNVQFEQGEPVEARLCRSSGQVDVAFLEVSLLEAEARETVWQVARQDKEVCDRLETGQPLWIMGSVRETADRTYGGSVVEPWIYLEDFENYMLLGHAYAIPGVSGGGVFTQDGILVGILCGGNEADEIAVLPWSVMEANRE